MEAFASIRKAVALAPFLWAGWVLAASQPAGFPLPVGHVYVDSAYTPATPGWGATHFQSLEDAAPAIESGYAVHIADGMTARIGGSLLLDGCLIDCTDSNGSYLVEVEAGSEFRMARSGISGCGGFEILGNETEIHSCMFSGTPIQIGVGTAGVRFFHNVLQDGSTLSDAGTGTVTELDGWSNVAAGSNTWNQLALAWSGTNLPAGRTLDADGLFLQPGDDAELEINLCNLSMPVAGCEMLLGYNGTYFTNGTFALVAPWEFNIYEAWNPGLGRLDTAIGLGMTAPREGIADDGGVATVAFQTRDSEGRTTLSFRPQVDELWSTRLASDTNGVSGTFLTPYTENSRPVTIDGTVPAIHAFRALQDQGAGDVDLFGGGTAIPGTVVVTMEASDELAGLAEPALAITHHDSPGTILVPVPLAPTNTAGGIRFAWSVAIDPLTQLGTYDVECTVADRSGNQADTQDSFMVGRAPLSVAVALQAASASDFNKETVFQALDAGGNELDAWMVDASYTGGVANVELAGIPEGTVSLAADTGISLRRILPVSLVAGAWVVDPFTGDNALVGGDLNGDNAINVLDYAVLRFNMQTTNPAADIDCNGAVNLLDYSIMRQNWQQTGD